MSIEYDFVIVGAGLFGSVCAYELNQMGYKCLVLEKRNVIGGNCYTEKVEDIHVHRYGAHIFHTDDEFLWNYVNRFAVFRQYNHSPVANYKGDIFSLPFNMWTFNKLWNVHDVDNAKKIIDSQKYQGPITNLEQQAKSMVGSDIFDKIIKGYTEKQWGKSCDELPPSIIKRLPIRFTWDNSYFSDRFVGIPVGGYTQIFDKLLENVEVRLGVDFFETREEIEKITNKIIYTGPIDKLFDYQFGKLDYRSLSWEEKIIDRENFQGTSVMNYTDYETPYTRIIEHKWFEKVNTKKTVISYEYPEKYDGKNEPFYPIRDEKNTKNYNSYVELSKQMNKYYFGGRLANYIYHDMHQIIASALKLIKNIKTENGILEQ